MLKIDKLVYNEVKYGRIRAKTDTIPASPAQAGEYTAAIAAIPTTPLLAANYTAPDAWHSENGFIGSTRRAQAFIWDKNKGLEAILNSNVNA